MHGRVVSETSNSDEILDKDIGRQRRLCSAAQNCLLAGISVVL